ncbi:beta-1,3-galactosyltransferase 5-like [Plodia interpunctella]|uniref:beta-1,3-galactosyltransferase 5-like n=1 Tax=Plodia interpunctella TaxID=58824 RepID=UPI0023674729|nr:beta-1,3-galactosyltransferase 5-like [Plodia interpunctella]
MILWPNPYTLTTIAGVLVMLCSIATQTELVSDRYVAGYEVSHPELCPAFGSELELIIFVTTVPSHFKERQAIRMTWGATWKFENVSFAFYIGTPPNESRSLILEENVAHGDIIIARFIDTYDNLTLKSLSMLEWINTHCPLVPRMLKTDDDMFINVPKLLHFIRQTIQKNKTNTIWGQLSKRNLPDRYNKTKYFVTYKEYPEKLYPRFLTGPAYLLSTDVTRDLFTTAANEPYFKIEDVFITGILAEKLKIKRIHINEFHNSKLRGEVCRLLDQISVHGFTSTELLKTWNKLQASDCPSEKTSD